MHEQRGAQAVLADALRHRCAGSSYVPLQPVPTATAAAISAAALAITAAIVAAAAAAAAVAAPADDRCGVERRRDDQGRE